MWIRIALVAALCFAIVVQTLRLKDEQADHAQTILDYELAAKNNATEANKVLNKRIEDNNKLVNDLQEMNERKTKELDDAKDANTKLAGLVKSGDVRLHVNVTPNKPVLRDNVPNSTSTRSMDDGQTYELAESVRPSYFSLRSGIETTTKQVEGLQEYILKVCRK